MRISFFKMKVVGLLSGGKDSVYNLLHCVAHGHEPIALASLGPPEGKGLLFLLIIFFICFTIPDCIGCPVSK